MPLYLPKNIHINTSHKVIELSVNIQLYKYKLSFINFLIIIVVRMFKFKVLLQES